MAAGFGTRLKPLTDKIPKCLIPIMGRPLIEYWFDLFEKYQVTDVLLNLYYLKDDIASYIKENKRKGVRIHLYYEEKLLGNAGTVLENEKFFLQENYFAIFYADSLTNINLNSMLKYHLSKKTDITIAAKEVANPSQSGILEIDSNNRLISFIEKPERPRSKLGNAGIYLVNRSLIDKIRHKKVIPLDFGRDVLSDEEIDKYAYIMNEYTIDIGTWPNYIQANYDVFKNIFSNCSE